MRFLPRSFTPTPAASVDVAWPDDPFYRPLVGFFDRGGRLLHIQPTRREQPHDAGVASWPCRCLVPTSRAEDPAGAPVIGICLENGRQVWDGREPGSTDRGTPDEPLTVDDIIGAAFDRQVAWDTSGFPAFLRLPALQQARLLYRDYCGNVPDPLWIAATAEALSAGASVLEIRDALLGSKAMDRRVLGRGEQVGNWVTWGGLKTLPASAALLQAMVAGGASVPVEPPLRPDADQLARLALGPSASPRTTARWKQDHAAAIAAFGDATTATPALASDTPSGTALSYRKLLGSMSLSTTAYASGAQRGVVSVRPGSPGHAMFGPYLSLRPGTYRLTVVLRGSAGSNVDPPPPELTLEAGYRATFLAQQSFPVPPSGHVAELQLDFPVMRNNVEALHEFRLWSDGRAAFEILDVSLLEIGREES